MTAWNTSTGTNMVPRSEAITLIKANTDTNVNLVKLVGGHDDQ